MTRMQRTILLVGLLLALAAVLFPPWRGRCYRDFGYSSYDGSHGYHFLLAAPAGSSRLDTARLGTELLAIGILTGGACIVLPTIAGVLCSWLSALAGLSRRIARFRVIRAPAVFIWCTLLALAAVMAYVPWTRVPDPAVLSWRQGPVGFVSEFSQKSEAMIVQALDAGVTLDEIISRSKSHGWNPDEIRKVAAAVGYGSPNQDQTPKRMPTTFATKEYADAARILLKEGRTVDEIAKASGWSRDAIKAVADEAGFSEPRQLWGTRSRRLYGWLFARPGAMQFCHRGEPRLVRLECYYDVRLDIRRLRNELLAVSGSGLILFACASFLARRRRLSLSTTAAPHPTS